MPSPSLHILCVEDEPDHAELLRLTLAQIPGLDADLHVQPDPCAVVATIDQRDFDLVFLDYQLGARTGLDVLRSIRAAGHVHPVIMLTAQGDEYVAVEVTRAGADEYLVKQDLTPEPSRGRSPAQTHSAKRAEGQALGRRLEHLESLSRALVESSTEIAIRSRSDALTGLLNRETMDEVIMMADAQAAASGRPYAIVFIDVDHFKILNDTVGHHAGDRALRAVAGCIRGASRDSDAVGRYGGEEFVVLLPDTDVGAAAAVAERMLESVRGAAIRHPGRADGRHVTISAGVAVGPVPRGWERVVVEADRAMYRAKEAGRDQVCAGDRPEARAPGP